MKIGAERNKVVALVVALGVLGVTLYVQFYAPGTPLTSPRRPSSTAGTPRAARPTTSTQAPTANVRVRGQNFRPKFGRSDSDEPLDPMTVDPTLRTDLLAKVRSVEFAGVERNLFRLGERKKVVPPPSKEKVDAAQERLKTLARQRANAKKAKAGLRAKKAPPIKFKYFGFAKQPGDNSRRAFLLDGEEVLIGGEGDIFKKRYKIVRIGISSIVVEDLQYKDKQTLRMEAS